MRLVKQFMLGMILGMMLGLVVHAVMGFDADSRALLGLEDTTQPVLILGDD